MGNDANDFLMSGGVPSAKFDKIGKVVKGTIIREPELQQQRDINTGEPKAWDDGKPMYQVKVIIATDERDSAIDDDNGERAVYLKGNSLKAVQEALRKAGATGLTVGGILAVKFYAEGEAKKKGFSKPKLYKAQYEKPAIPVADVKAENESEDEEDF